MLIKISHVDVSKAGTGRNQYEIAEVTFSAFGKVKTFKVFSFVNPQVFKVLANATPGEEYNVVVGKNEKGYDAWNAIEAATAEGKAEVGTAKSKPETTRFAGDRESKDEREARQRYIIRQSSLSNAVAILTVGAKSSPKLDDVKALAEDLVKFVYDIPTEAQATDLFHQPNDIDQDIPY